MHRIKSIAKRIVPPILLDLWLYKKPTYARTDAWNETSDPFSSTLWIQEKLADEPNGHTAKDVDKFFLCTLISDLSKERRIKVVDFGGGIGELYESCVANADANNVDYIVVDSTALINVGRKKHSRISFIDSRSVKASDIYGADLIFLRGVLQYVKDWKALIRFLLDTEPKYLVLSRHLSPDNSSETILATQRIQTRLGYAGDCCVHLTNWKEICREANNAGYDLVSTFVTDRPRVFGSSTDTGLGITGRLIIFKQRRLSNFAKESRKFFLSDR